MLKTPFERPGRFWKGNLHMHSTRSDGTRDVAALIATYMDQGYDFVSVTDHYMERFDFPIVDTSPYRTETFTTLFGAELHTPAVSHGEPWHLVANGLPLDFAPTADGETGPELARRAVDAGAFVSIAHPNWYSLTLADGLTIDAAHAVEIYNHKSSRHNDKGDAWHFADQMLMAGRHLTAIASDDAHFFPGQPDHFGGWVHVKAEANTPDHLLAALKAGDFYASQGPELKNITLTGDEITVHSSPVQAIFVTGPGSRARNLRQEMLTEATFLLEPFIGGYVRVTVIDAMGKRAWSNPHWLDGSS